jgi:hypothetical protein
MNKTHTRQCQNKNRKHDITSVFLLYLTVYYIKKPGFSPDHWHLFMVICKKTWYHITKMEAGNAPPKSGMEPCPGARGRDKAG